MKFDLRSLVFGLGAMWAYMLLYIQIESWFNLTFSNTKFSFLIVLVFSLLVGLIIDQLFKYQEGKA